MDNNKEQKNCSEQNTAQHNTLDRPDNSKECKNQCNNKTLQYLTIIVPVVMIFIQFMFSLHAKNVDVSNQRDAYFAQKQIDTYETILSLVMDLEKADSIQDLEMNFEMLDKNYLGKLKLYGDDRVYVSVAKLLNFVRDYLYTTGKNKVPETNHDNVPEVNNNKEIKDEIKVKIRSLAVDIIRSAKQAIHTP
ncbi:hypothetical protein [Shewanella colwelliana]|uniref:hypothetical protein n=1 Tax=Shewanella colwelliana TaxID=23 RepID=UPI0022AECB7A|nr:hypothetical protein [Shewanella colwelliana]MCZ4337685.1 hypothetical protein [Shewanella colwelliana]